MILFFNFILFCHKKFKRMRNDEKFINFKKFEIYFYSWGFFSLKLLKFWTPVGMCVLSCSLFLGIFEGVCSLGKRGGGFYWGWNFIVAHSLDLPREEFYVRESTDSLNYPPSSQLSPLHPTKNLKKKMSSRNYFIEEWKFHTMFPITAQKNEKNAKVNFMMENYVPNINIDFHS